MIKPKRGLSGIYLRFHNPETDKWENRVFEDLPEREQEKFLDSLDRAGLVRMVQHLSTTLRELGDQFDLTTYTEE